MADLARHAMYYGLTDCFDRLYEYSKNNQNFENLMELITSEEVILLAYRSIKRNDGSATPGVDNVTIRDIEEWTVSKLVRSVRNKFTWYVPKPIKRVEIPKESDPTKTRPLGIPCYIERLCQECIKLVLEPIVEAKFNPNSFGFRPHRSCENALAVCADYMNIEQMRYVVDVDIRSFFDCVGHGCLMRQMWRLGIHDRKLLAIIYAMLKAPILYPDGSREIPYRGVPQGGVLSPILANICLNDLDWFISNKWDTYPLNKEYRSQQSRVACLRRMGVRKVHIVRYADDFKLFCETREDAQALLKEVAEWLKSKLGLETSPEKSGITNLRRNYTCFLGIEIKYKSRAERLPPDYKGRKRKWVTTSRIKRKALGKIEGKLDREMMSLKSAGTADTAKAVEKYNSVVDGIVNYFSMASQVSRDLNGVQKNLKMRMHNQLDGITGEVPEGYRPGSATDKRQSRSKSALYLKGHLVHSLGYCKFRCPKRLVKDMCDYTTVGRSIQGIKTGVPPPILALLGRHPPPGMLVEVADNRVSSYSSQKGLCAILDVPIPPGGFDTVLKIPSKTRDKYRFGNIALLSPLASQVISAPKWEDVEKLLQGYSLSNEQLAKIQKYRQWRKLPIN